MSTTTDRASRRSITLVAALVLAAGALSTLAGCNTTEGFGKDVQSAGEGISNAAEKSK